VADVISATTILGQAADYSAAFDRAASGLLLSEAVGEARVSGKHNQAFVPVWLGLSYSTFKYANVRLAPDTIGEQGETKVSVDVTNAGKVRGDEVVQLYIRDEVSSVTRPVKELRGFRRISLKPGETKTVELALGQTSCLF